MTGSDRFHIAFATIFAFLAVAAGTAMAQECKLQQIASLPITWTEEGRFTIPVGIEGSQRNLLFDTGAPASVIDFPTATELNLTRKRIIHGVFYDSSGHSASESAVIRELTMGNLLARDVHILVNPNRDAMGHEFSGILGAEILQGQDVDLDFVSKKLNIFSQDHCPGQVVYWPANAVAVVPVTVLFESGHIIVPVTLDGKNMDALFDTGASDTFLTLQAAHNRLGLGSKDMTPAGEMNGDPVYKHTFKSLVLEGITINNPEIVLYSDRMRAKSAETPEAGSHFARKASGDVDLILGMGQLRRFHIYIAYKEKKLYITTGGP